MKLIGLSTITTYTAAILLLAGTSQAAELVAGTEIGIDFGSFTATNDFNDLDASANGSITSGNINDTLGTTVDGVSFSWVSTHPWFNNTTSISIPGQPVVFDESNLTDWLGATNSSSPTGNMTLTFSGLDDSLTYDVIVGAGFPLQKTPM